AVPLLTRDPTTKAADIVGDIVARAANRESMTEDPGPDQVIRESCITLIILVGLLQLKLIALKPLEMPNSEKPFLKLIWRLRKLLCSCKLSNAPRTRPRPDHCISGVREHS